MSTALLIVSYFVFILLFAIGVCWLWPDFVDSSDPPKVRAVLFVILGIATSFEILIWLTDIVKSWTLVLIIFTNVWGMGDAFLRFPVVHDIDSLFGLKQVCVLLVKIVGYSLGFRDITAHVGWFVLVILGSIFTVPICWLTALPIGDCNSYHMKHDVVDVDIVIRIWRLIWNPRDREMLRVHCRTQSLQNLLWLTQTMPFLTPLASKCDPSLAHALRKKPSV
mmetsp:Transcript_84424/g.131863  ORF Transcript_84424/g.131863 Transcript_84424/m.131863 type:complete len:222 (+) Transcript_84424:58-723(+)